MKKTIIIVVLLLIAIGIWYAYRLYHEKNEDLAQVEAAYSINALSLISAFEKDSAAASRKFIDQVIQVDGLVKSINADGNPVVISLGDPNQMSSVLCSMDSTHAKAYGEVKEGSSVRIKGKCNGYESEDLLGTDVKLNRCVVVTPGTK